MHENKNIYCEAALFRCNCCNYETEIYYDEEFLKESEECLCDKCGHEGHHKFDIVVIYRDDIDGTISHPQCAELPDDKNKCKSCSGIEKISWKEVVVACMKYHKDSMHYVQDVEGKNMKLFEEQCKDWAKPAHPNIGYLDEKGISWQHLNGILAGISAN